MLDCSIFEKLTSIQLKKTLFDLTGCLTKQPHFSAKSSFRQEAVCMGFRQLRRTASLSSPTSVCCTKNKPRLMGSSVSGAALHLLIFPNSLIVFHNHVNRGARVQRSALQVKLKNLQDKIRDQRSQSNRYQLLLCPEEATFYLEPFKFNSASTT